MLSCLHGNLAKRAWFASLYFLIFIFYNILYSPQHYRLWLWCSLYRYSKGSVIFSDTAGAIRNSSEGLVSMCYQNMERMRSPGKPVVQTRSCRQRKKPLLAVTVKCAKIMYLFKQSAAHDEERSEGHLIANSWADCC